MSTLNITISTDGAAFHDDAFPPGEAMYVEILATLARSARSVRSGETSGTLRDSNGNTCGEWSLTDA